MSLKNLQHDLSSWEHLYLSGRLHKPVLWLKDSPKLADTVQSNLRAALAVAILLLPEEFDDRVEICVLHCISEESIFFL